MARTTQNSSKLPQADATSASAPPGLSLPSQPPVLGKGATPTFAYVATKKASTGKQREVPTEMRNRERSPSDVDMEDATLPQNIGDDNEDTPFNTISYKKGKKATKPSPDVGQGAAPSGSGAPGRSVSGQKRTRDEVSDTGADENNGRQRQPRQDSPWFTDSDDEAMPRRREEPLRPSDRHMPPPNPSQQLGATSTQPQPPTGAPTPGLGGAATQLGQPPPPQTPQQLPTPSQTTMPPQSPAPTPVTQQPPTPPAVQQQPPPSTQAPLQQQPPPPSQAPTQQQAPLPAQAPVPPQQQQPLPPPQPQQPPQQQPQAPTQPPAPPAAPLQTPTQPPMPNVAAQFGLQRMPVNAFTERIAGYTKASLLKNVAPEQAILADTSTLLAIVHDSKYSLNRQADCERVEGVIANFANDPNAIVVAPEAARATDSSGSPYILFVTNTNPVSTAQLTTEQTFSTSTTSVYFVDHRQPSDFICTMEGGRWKIDDALAAATSIRQSLTINAVFHQWFATNRPAGTGMDFGTALTDQLNTIYVRPVVLREGTENANTALNFFMRPVSSVERTHQSMIDLLRAQRYRDFTRGTSFPIPRPFHCNHCHSATHPSPLCPFPSMAGWLGPPLPAPTPRNANDNGNKRGNGSRARNGNHGGRGGRRQF